MTRRAERNLERQTALVVRLAGQLRFELLLLRRMRSAGMEAGSASGSEPTLAEIHAAAVLRDADVDLSS